MIYGSVCSGIESASVAWEPLGLRPAWFSEIEPFPSDVLSHHWPNVANMGDMTKVADMVRAGLVPAPDILVGGTPCQAFSVAGLRRGMDDERGQLTLTYVDILNAIDERRGGGNEAVCVWENVPGVLSSKDNAFGCFLGALAGESCELQPAGKRWSNAGCVFGSQRTVAWRVLDAQFFGVAQRRRRVFVVASARDGFDPRKVLFESEGLRRDIAPSRETREAPSPSAPSRSGDNCIAIAGNIIGRKPENGGNGACTDSSGAMYTLTVADRHAVLPVGALDTQCGYQQQAFQSVSAGHVIGTLTARDVEEGMAGVTNYRARKLTPVECERLQGFPDNHTQIPWRGKPAEDCPDGPRYKACGNSKAVPVARFVGLRLISELIRCAT